ncbi:MAG: CHAT domain-containing protein [Micromonosporaceae bacterium]|nr:CHAT domain-containing protein [Micromonosporaceae bacterium]
MPTREPPCTTALAELAARALDTVQRQPATAVALAAQVLSCGDASPVERATAERATGLALRELGDLRGALRHLRRAERVAQQAGEARVAALARMSLGYVLANSGRNAAALRAVSAALADLTGADAGRARMQRGVVLHFCGRHREAVRDYDVAVEIAQREGDRLLEARARNNRGLLQAVTGRDAQDDLDRAADIFRGLGLELAAADVAWNIGIAAGQRGEVSRALHTFRTVEREYQRLAVPRPALLLDRFELLLSVPLLEEAHEVAVLAVNELRRRRMDSDLAEALLARSRVALLAGDLDTAAATAAQAGRRLRRQGRPAWAALARHVELRARYLRGSRSVALLTAMTRTAELLDAARWSGPALITRIEAARVAIERGRTGQARELLQVAGRARSRGVAVQRTQGWYAVALLRRLDGDNRGAAAALRHGLAVLDAYRATLGATELRTHSGMHGLDLAREGLDLALASGRARAVLDWAERCRATVLRMAPAAPPGDPELARALAELRLVSAALEEAVLAGNNVQRLRRRQVDLERQVRELARRGPGGPGAAAPPGTAGGPPVLAPPAVGELSAALGEAALVEFVVHGDRVLAVVVAGGRTSLHDLAAVPPLAREVRLQLFALRRLVLYGVSSDGYATDRHRAAARQAARSSAEAIDAAVLRPLRRRLGNRPLVVVPSGPLHGVPWSALPTCAGRSVTVAPSAAAWLRAAGRPTPAGSPVLVAGPRLPEAAEEVAALARQLPGARVLTGAAATTQAVVGALDGARLAHIAAHGRFRADNALFSQLELADGPLTGYELERVGQSPGCIVLSACEVGQAAVRPGEELIGFTTVLLGLGTRSLVASLLPVPAERTVALMLDLHRRMLAGAGPPSALAQAQQAFVAGVAGGEADAAGTDLATAAAFVCYGAG